MYFHGNFHGSQGPIADDAGCSEQIMRKKTKTKRTPVKEDSQLLGTIFLSFKSVPSQTFDLPKVQLSPAISKPQILWIKVRTFARFRTLSSKKRAAHSISLQT